jgi:hypothetical protein
LLVIAAVLGMGMIYVVFPVFVATFMGYRKNRQVHCPEEKKTATVNVDAQAAALSAVVGKNRVQIKNCSLWPERRDCAQECIAQV